jgi:hypothetical protein
VYLLFVDKGKYGFPLLIAPGINAYAVISTVVTITGFPGGFAVIENPADFEFPLFRDKGRIFEHP